MVNIVMIAKDRRNLTYQALDSLFRTTPSELFNLTLIDDDGCNDDIPEQFRLDYKADIVSAAIRPSKGIVGLVRNIGADFAQRYWGRGDWLYFSDNDVCFHEGWLEKMIEAAMKDPMCRILGGARHPFHGVNFLSHCRDGLYIEQADAVAGYSMLMRWSTWDAYGPFDQHARGVSQSEDFAVCQKLKPDDYYVGYVHPPVLTVCGLTNTLGEKVPGWEQLKAMVPEGVIAE